MLSELCPGFLVASPSLLDPNFQRALVLLVDHTPEGSLGFIMNRPGNITLGGVVDELGLEGTTQSMADVPVLLGGPVAPHTGWLVFEPGEMTPPTEGTITVNEHLHVSASRELLKDIVRCKDPMRLMLVLGYAGWGAGQLDAEIKAGAWIPVDLDERIIFDTPYDERWRAAFNTLGIDPTKIVSSASFDA